MERESVGHGELGVDDAVDHVLGDAGDDVAGRTHGRQRELARADDLVRALAEVASGLRGATALEDRLEFLLEVAQCRLRLLHRDVAAADE